MAKRTNAPAVAIPAIAPREMPEGPGPLAWELTERGVGVGVDTGVMDGIASLQHGSVNGQDRWTESDSQTRPRFQSVEIQSSPLDSVPQSDVVGDITQTGAVEQYRAIPPKHQKLARESFGGDSQPGRRLGRVYTQYLVVQGDLVFPALGASGAVDHEGGPGESDTGSVAGDVCPRDGGVVVVVRGEGLAVELGLVEECQSKCSNRWPMAYRAFRVSRRGIVLRYLHVHCHVRGPPWVFCFTHSPSIPHLKVLSPHQTIPPTPQVLTLDWTHRVDPIRRPLLQHVPPRRQPHPSIPPGRIVHRGHHAPFPLRCPDAHPRAPERHTTFPRRVEVDYGGMYPEREVGDGEGEVLRGVYVDPGYDSRRSHQTRGGGRR